MRQVGKKVSYVRNPLAKNSYGCLGLSFLGLLLGGVSMYLSVSQGGQGGLNVGAYGFSSLAASCAAMWYGLLSFVEKEKNYILAKIGCGLSLVLIIVWIVIIITGVVR